MRCLETSSRSTNGKMELSLISPKYTNNLSWVLSLLRRQIFGKTLVLSRSETNECFWRVGLIGQLAERPMSSRCFLRWKQNSFNHLKDFRTTRLVRASFWFEKSLQEKNMTLALCWMICNLFQLLIAWLLSVLKGLFSFIRWVNKWNWNGRKGYGIRG